VLSTIMSNIGVE